MIHKNLAENGWYNLTLAEQMGNIGSEVSRALNWGKKNNPEMQNRAIIRALELFELTKDDERWLKRNKEICRAREVICDFFYNNNEYKTTGESLLKYFDQFALLARQRR